MLGSVGIGHICHSYPDDLVRCSQKPDIRGISGIRYIRGVLKSLIRHQRFSLDLRAPGKVKVLVVRLTEDDVVGSVASKGAQHSRWVSQRGEHPAGALS